MSVKLFSGDIYRFPIRDGMIVADLKSLVSDTLDTPVSSITLFSDDRIVYDTEPATDSSYNAWIEKKVDVFLYASRGGDVTMVRKYLYSSTEEGEQMYITVLTDTFTPSILERIRVELWEKGHDTSSLGLVELFHLYLKEEKVNVAGLRLS
jgi:hypothetical protein